MHLADILVLGPFPLVGRSIRLRLGVALVGVLALLLAAGAALVVADEQVAVPIRSLALGTLGRQAAPTSVAIGTPTRLQSRPSGAEILLDGQVVGETPAETVVAGHPVALRRGDAPEVRLLDTSSSTVIPVWAKASVFAVRPPVPGGAITDLTLLGDGRLALSVASPGGPSGRQAWILDPGGAHQERVVRPFAWTIRQRVSLSLPTANTPSHCGAEWRRRARPRRPTISYWMAHTGNGRCRRVTSSTTTSG